MRVLPEIRGAGIAKNALQKLPRGAMKNEGKKTPV
jgi:hypothetical protein